MEQIFQRLLNSDLAELSGLTVDATVPVSEALVNELIASTLHDNTSISDLRLTIHSDNRLSVNVKSPRWPWPVQLKMRLFSSVDLTSSPKVRAFLENNVFLGKVGQLLGALPPGVLLYEDQISIDLGVFIPPEQKRLVGLLKAVDLSTEEGRVMVEVQIRK